MKEALIIFLLYFCVHGSTSETINIEYSRIMSFLEHNDDDKTVFVPFNPANYPKHIVNEILASCNLNYKCVIHTKQEKESKWLDDEARHLNECLNNYYKYCRDCMNEQKSIRQCNLKNQKKELWFFHSEYWYQPHDSNVPPDCGKTSIECKDEQYLCRIMYRPTCNLGIPPGFSTTIDIAR